MQRQAEDLGVFIVLARRSYDKLIFLLQAKYRYIDGYEYFGSIILPYQQTAGGQSTDLPFCRMAKEFSPIFMFNLKILMTYLTFSELLNSISHF